MAHPNSKRAKAAKAKRQQTRAESTANDPHKKAQLAERQAKRSGQLADRQRQASLRKVRTYTIAAVSAAALVVGGWFALRPGPELAGVERPPDNGRGHIVNASFASTTPTSGPHSAQSPRCGFYPTPLDLELAVHGLEHGAVVLWYDASQPSLAGELGAATQAWDSHVIISPSSSLDAPIVATAWNRRLAYESVDDGVVDFVDTYRKRGPERVSCDNA